MASPADIDAKEQREVEFLQAQLEFYHTASRNISADINWPAHYLQFRVDLRSIDSWNAKTLAQVAAHIESIEGKSLLGMFPCIDNTIAKGELDQCKKELKRHALSADPRCKGADKVACGAKFNKLLENYSVAFLEAMEILAINMQKEYDYIEPYIEQETERLCEQCSDFAVTDSVVTRLSTKGRKLVCEHWLGVLLVENMSAARIILPTQIKRSVGAAKKAAKKTT